MKPYYYISLVLLTMTLGACSGGSDHVKSISSSPASSQSDTGDKIPVVKVMELQPADFFHEIVSNGKLSASHKVDVNFDRADIITEILVHNGQKVSAGQTLARLDRSRLETTLAKERTAVAQAQLELKDVLIGQGYDPDYIDNVPDETMRLARLRSGLEQAEISLAATERDIELSTLKAPITGIVANLTTSPHNTSNLSEPFCSIIDNSSMRVGFTVLESELPLVKPGDPVDIAPYSTSEVTRGRIAEINPTVDDNGMVRVWADVDGHRSLLDGMNVRVTVKRLLEHTLTVPKSAVVLRSGRQVVFTLDGNKARWNYVTTGLENLDSYTVTDGLEAGAQVIISGNENLAHESELKVENCD